jgi:hypothetical protein
MYPLACMATGQRLHFNSVFFIQGIDGSPESC